MRSVTVGEGGAFEGMGAGAVFVDHTTASADVAREVAAVAAERGIGFLDAPVSGGEAGAVNGVLTVMVGGERDVFDRCSGVIDAYARAVTLLGPVGSGQLTKMANQICIAGVVQGLSEALNLAERSGLDAKLVLDVISKGAAQSWQMENRGATMVDDEFEFGFAVDWMRKDLDICLAQGHRVGALLPLTALVNEFYARVAGARRRTLGYLQPHAPSHQSVTGSRSSGARTANAISRGVSSRVDPRTVSPGGGIR